MVIPGDLIDINVLICRHFGQESSLRDPAALEAVVASASEIIFSQDATPRGQAWRLGRSLVRLHPFLDGNKRTAIVAMDFLLAQEGLSWDNPPIWRYDLVMGWVGEGECPEMSTFSVSDGDPGRKGIDIIMVDNFDVLHALADEPTSCPECRGWGISTVAEACSSCGGRGCVNCSDGAVPVEKPCGLCGGRGEIPPREWLEMMGDSLG